MLYSLKSFCELARVLRPSQHLSTQCSCLHGQTPGSSQTAGLAPSSLAHLPHTCRCGRYFLCLPVAPRSHTNSPLRTRYLEFFLFEPSLTTKHNSEFDRSRMESARSNARLSSDIPQIFPTSQTMDYQAPAPAAGGRGCYNCKIPEYRLEIKFAQCKIAPCNAPPRDCASGLSKQKARKTLHSLVGQQQILIYPNRDFPPLDFTSSLLHTRPYLNTDSEQ